MVRCGRGWWLGEKEEEKEEDDGDINRLAGEGMW